MENEEVIPQSGRERDIAITEIVVGYIVTVEAFSRRKERYSNLTIHELREMLNWAKYKNLEIRDLSYKILMEVSRDKLAETFAEADTPQRKQQEELIEMLGLNSQQIESLYFTMLKAIYSDRN